MQEQQNLSNFDDLVSSVDLTKKKRISFYSRKRMFFLIFVTMLGLFGSSLLFGYYINPKNDNISKPTESSLNNSFYSISVKENTIIVSSPHQNIVINKNPDGGSSITISSN